MAITFPDRTATGASLVPSSRTFTAGVYPTKVYRSLAGTTVKRSFGNKPAAFQLSLVFRNIFDDTAALILKHYTDTDAGFTRFRLPLTIFDGASSELLLYLREPGNIRWEYAAPPEVESVFRNISTVSVQLTGEMNV